MKKLLHVGCGPKTLANIPARFDPAGWEECQWENKSVPIMGIEKCTTHTRDGYCSIR